MINGPTDGENRGPPQFSILAILVVTLLLTPCFLAFKYGGFGAALSAAVVVGAAWTVVCFYRLVTVAQQSPNREPIPSTHVTLDESEESE